MSTVSVFIICMAACICVCIICYTVYSINSMDYSSSEPVRQYVDEMKRLQNQSNTLYAEICNLKKQLNIDESDEETEDEI